MHYRRDSDSFRRNRPGSEITPSKRFPSKVYEEPRPSGVIDREPEKPMGTDVIVSNTDVSDNSVTVSVICPERAPELFSRSQPKRKRELGDVSLGRYTFPSDVPAVSGERTSFHFRHSSIFLESRSIGCVLCIKSITASLRRYFRCPVFLFFFGCLFYFIFLTHIPRLILHSRE